MNLDKKLDTIHSIYIRLKNTDENGFGKCVTCGTTHKYINLQNGHYIDRANTQFRWLEDNCNIQCEDCNCYKSGNLIKYREYMIDKHGISHVIALETQSLRPFKVSKSDKESLLKLRRSQCRILLKDKNFSVSVP